MSLPIPKPAMTGSSVGSGRLEVSATEDGQVLLSAMGADGDYQWFKMPAAAAVGLAAALSARAHALLEEETR